MHTPTAPTALHGVDPRFIRVLLGCLAAAVIVVAFVANGAAYLGGVSFVENVMKESPARAWIFGGVIELSLGVVALATFIEAYRLRPTAGFRTATWFLSGVSGIFGALYEIVEYVAGHLGLVAALSSAGWRVFAPFLAAGLWELVIHLFCGTRHRAYLMKQKQTRILFVFFRAAEREGLVHGIPMIAPITAALARSAARAVHKHVPDADERDRALARALESARFARDVRVQTAALAHCTVQDMRGDLSALHSVQSAPSVHETGAPAVVHETDAPAVVQPECAFVPVHVATVRVQRPTPPAPTVVHDDYTARVEQATRRETAAILADVPPAKPTQEQKPAVAARSKQQRTGGSKRDVCMPIVRAFLAERPDAAWTEIRDHLLAATEFEKVSRRSIFDWRNEARDELVTV